MSLNTVFRTFVAKPQDVVLTCLSLPRSLRATGNRCFVTTPQDVTPLSLQRFGPLYGIKILDLSRVLAAPFASMLLGDLG